MTSLPAQNIRRIRKTASVSGTLLADRMSALGFTSWTQSTISAVERDARSLKVEELLAVSFILDVSPLALLLPYENPDELGLDLESLDGVEPLTLEQIWDFGRGEASPRDSDDGSFRVRSLPMTLLRREGLSSPLAQVRRNARENESETG